MYFCLNRWISARVDNFSSNYFFNFQIIHSCPSFLRTPSPVFRYYRQRSIHDLFTQLVFSNHMYSIKFLCKTQYFYMIMILILRASIYYLYLLLFIFLLFYKYSLSFSTFSISVAQLVANLTTVCFSSVFSQKLTLTFFSSSFSFSSSISTKIWFVGESI